MKIFRSAMLAVLALAVVGYWFFCIPQSVQPDGAASLERFKPGPYAVVVDDFKAEDRSRPTAPNGDFHGSASRIFKGAIWRPRDPASPGPLLIYSHGFMSFHQEGEYLVRFLASHGATVIAVDYPLTNYFAPGGPLLTDVVNQPGDVHFLIDTLLARASDPQDVLHGTINPEQIAVAGVSLGGLTSELAAFHRTVRDPRIKAAISIAGPAFMLAPAFFAGSPVPFMMIAGDADAIIPYASNAKPIPEKDPGAILVTLHQASHAGFAAPAATLMRFAANPDRVGCRALEHGLQNVRLDHFMDSLAGADVGVVPSPTQAPCTYGIPQHAMNAARQHMLATLAVSAFLDSQFAADSAAREAAHHYLLETLPAEEASDVSVQGGAR